MPPDRTALPCKWVFKRKLNADGSIERYKARLVLKGFRQRYGIDYDAVFAPIVRMSTVRLFFSVVAARDLECHSIDIKMRSFKAICGKSFICSSLRATTMVRLTCYS